MALRRVAERITRNVSSADSLYSAFQSGSYTTVTRSPIAGTPLLVRPIYEDRTLLSQPYNSVENFTGSLGTQRGVVTLVQGPIQQNMFRGGPTGNRLIPASEAYRGVGTIYNPVPKNQYEADMLASRKAEANARARDAQVTAGMWDGPYLTTKTNYGGQTTQRKFGTDYPYDTDQYGGLNAGETASQFFMRALGQNVRLDRADEMPSSYSTPRPVNVSFNFGRTGSISYSAGNRSFKF